MPGLHIYLAGPDVFWPDAREAGAAKVTLCDRYGCTGLFPLDSELDLQELSPYDAGLAIYRANIGLMQRADLVIANMTPFRGPSMDVGTAFELGYMAALGKPVWGYSLDGRLYSDRVAGEDAEIDSDGMTIERFDMADNLMLIGAIEDSGGRLISDTAEHSLDAHLAVFEKVLRLALDRA
ncbi:nucleoside 2-deoxyribosyltransferase [Marinobacterium nitratireducens]|uniref:Nucleoside 2-deoxyribosyltransferase n=1 Tax=Marinobacterium nitratireducens TaxID=518897 RepID=A0A918DX42_9GAMM|nr:nucleoside 2-deoxyribosyltransferase [Marinobacterium nitratireducens]GGO88708.1 nucleoside 2-deoxyribosyltransferase [Marinobacterium nitratireducens]